MLGVHCPVASQAGNATGGSHNGSMHDGYEAHRAACTQDQSDTLRAHAAARMPALLSMAPALHACHL